MYLIDVSLTCHQYFTEADSKAGDDDDDEDYDKFGCCLSCGEFFCPSTDQCISDWDNCDLGSSQNDIVLFFL